MNEPAGLLIVGAGPAGMALLSAAHDAGTLGDLVDDGLCVVDPCPPDRVGAGRLSGYVVRSDTSGRVFTECASASMTRDDDASAALLDSCDRDGPVELTVAATLLAAAATTVMSAAAGRSGRDIFVRGRAVDVQPGPEYQTVVVETATGTEAIAARSVVLATGGSPAIPAWLQDADLSGELVHSDAVIRGQLPPRFVAARSRAPRIVVVGGSHSAFSATTTLLGLDPERLWPDAAITVMHRSPVRVTYFDVESAIAEGFAFDDDDVCPLTGRIHRFGGLRTDSADLWRRVRDGVEPRVRLTQLGPGDAGLANVVKSADLVVAATGYASSAAALLPGWSAPPRFDGHGRLVDDGDAIVPGIYGMGLGAGRRRDDSTGGEPSFKGAIDGVWFYQHVVAPAVLTQLTDRDRLVGV